MDITQAFKEACTALPTSARVVKKPTTTYLELMNALLIFAPRTDTGSSIIFQDECNFEPSPDHTPQEVCAIIDRLLVLEMAWWRGSTLSQTIYTNLHFFYPETLGESSSPVVSIALRIYVVAFVKTVELVWNEISKKHVNDSEDMWMDHYGIPISLTDPVEDIVNYMQFALSQLNRGDPWEEDVHVRLENRMTLLLCLHVYAQGKIPHSTLDHMRELLDRPLHLQTDYPKEGFEDNMPSYIRQSMPLLPVHLPSVEESYQELFYMTHDLMRLSQIVLNPHVKSTIEKHVDGDFIIDSLIAEETCLPMSIIHQLELPPNSAKQLIVWRDLVRGLAFSTQMVPIMNPCRQRRSHSSLSFSWYQRAAFAEMFPLDPTFRKLSQFLHCMRLDCLLNVALAAWDLDLITPREERCAWWWVEQVTRERCALSLRPTWKSVWAQVWLNISRAMQALLPLPSLTTTKELSLEEFCLRYKWARKRPLTVTGVKVYSGLFPKYRSWQASKRQWDSFSEMEVRQMAIENFEDALRALETLLRQLRGSAIVSSVTILRKV
ncbi:hypothetical protein M231_07309 [Tremella mesenterica]|uniref:NAA35-like N-terminal domain-containing protein n=1 Tax=Tremella mesenterica TaxID=5217 RepID=A0A4Q1BCL7_TREME|nr:hypothetical protein M231_07309 [Tremella mesenterica]